MIGKYLCATVLAASVALIPAEESQAGDAAKILGGAIVGGAIVHGIHQSQKRKQQASRNYRRSYSGISSAQRQQNRDVQTALNYFGYNVGVVDGSLGRQSRAGISRYQAEMGFTPDGYLDGHERNFLLSSYHRALSSAHVPPYNQVLASQGQAGLLRTYRNEQLGIATPQAGGVQPQGQLAVAPPAAVQPYAQPVQPQGQLAALPQASTQPLAPAPAPAQPQSQVAALPVLGGIEPEQTTARADTSGQLPAFAFATSGASANQLCNSTDVLTAQKGEVSAAGAATDPALALNQQFCDARIAAMAEGQRLEETASKMTAPETEQLCNQLTSAISTNIVNIDSASPSSVIAATSTTLRDSGQPISTLVTGGEICLGVGYRTDNGEMTLASATLLTAAGQTGFAELVSHQLREGVGTGKAQKSVYDSWMSMAIDAAKGGAPVLGQTPERLAVLSAATSPSGATAASSLPVFNTSGD